MCFVHRCRFGITSSEEDAVIERKMEDHVVRVHVKELGIQTLIEELGVHKLIPYAIDGFLSEEEENELIERYLKIVIKEEEKEEENRIDKGKSENKDEWNVRPMVYQKGKIGQLETPRENELNSIAGHLQFGQGKVKNDLENNRKKDERGSQSRENVRHDENSKPGLEVNLGKEDTKN